MAPYPQTTETPGPQGFSSSVWTGTHMLVWGGYAFTEACRRCVHDDGAAYDLNTDSWALMAPSGLSARGGHRAVWTGKEMVVWGGVGGGPGPPHLNDGAAYNPADDTWSQLPNSPLLARQGHAMVWVGEKMVVWGGEGSNGGGYTNHDDGAVLSLRG
jgi:N-acetylneuraminic acid mutarotase